ncbi:hypothetical protein H8E88_16620 [candidate division KSB1 bacterium]|nr:hypothetical protein [candidate division KSB1 bacterium]
MSNQYIDLPSGERLVIFGQKNNGKKKKRVKKKVIKIPGLGRLHIDTPKKNKTVNNKKMTLAEFVFMVAILVGFFYWLLSQWGGGQ